VVQPENNQLIMPFAAILFILIVVVILPFLSLYNLNIIDKITLALPPKKKIYIQSAQNQLVLMLLGLWAITSSKLEFNYVGNFPPTAFIGGGVFLALGFGFSLITSRSKKMQESNPGIEMLQPETTSEKVTWVMVNAVAATCEEIIFRGALFVLFYSTTKNMVAAGAMSAVCFGFSHSIQGPVAILVTMIFGAGLQYLAWLNEGLLLPMIVHFIYNIGITFLMSRQKDTLEVDGETAVAEQPDNPA
jgi:membrane protease YdiL (CAAX protease family)